MKNMQKWEFIYNMEDETGKRNGSDEDAVQ